MKKQVSVGIAALLMASAAFAIKPIEVKSAHQKDREKRVEPGVRPEISAAGKSNADTKRLERISETARFAGLSGRSINVLETFEARRGTMKVKSSGKDGQVTTQNVAFEGDKVIKNLESARAMRGENAEINQQREEGAKVATQLAELVESKIMDIPAAKEMNSQALKFLSDYAEALVDGRSTAADLEGYNLTARGMLEYSRQNADANLHDIYEKGVPEDARKRQEDCLKMMAGA